MARRYDPEFAAAVRFKAALDQRLSAALRQASPVVTFYDPMAQDDAHRVVVETGEFNTHTNDAQSWDGEITVTVKSQTQEGKKLQASIEAHFDRTNEVREALHRDTLVDDLNAGSVGLGFNQVSPDRKVSTDVREGWIYSDMKLLVSCHARAAADDVPAAA